MDTQKGVPPVPVPEPVSTRETRINLDSPDVFTAESVRLFALQAGFTEAGLVPLPHQNQARDAWRFTDWIHAGYSGSMRYLARRDDAGRLIRARTDVPFPWARSAIVCLASYNSPQPLSVHAAPPDSAWIARYAWSSRTDATGARRPSDYHKILLRRLTELDALLRRRFGEFQSRAYVDTGPLVERNLAVAAGLGWTGKNTCLIHQRLGSFVFLAVLLTSLEPDPEPRALAAPDRCGSCTRCIDACPTGALIAPYRMDATRCTSYLTIEHRGPLDEELMKGMGRQVFGCDICQDVCPWNSPRRVPIAADPELAARPELVNPALDWLAGLDETAFERMFNGSPVRRAGFNGFRRNIAVAIGNSGARRLVSFLDRWAAEADEGLRKAAQWAIAALRSAPARDDSGQKEEGTTRPSGSAP